MRITTAWVQESDGTATLHSAYVEVADGTWDPAPNYYIEAIQEARANGQEVRELGIQIPDSAITKLFRTPTVVGRVAEA